MSTAQAIHALHAEKSAAEESRGYLGWSSLGEACERALWYGFRWAGSKPIEGRIARLFDTGHREEARVLQELRDLGYEVYDRDTNGQQFAVESLAGHLRGHADAVVVGLPESPATPHLVDVKTIKSKKFDELLKKGMAATFPKYIAQGLGYCGLMQLTRAAFIFVCKDDDRIHTEFFDFDQVAFDALMVKARRVIEATEPPPKIGGADDFACKFCNFHSLCHGTQAAEVNCRTCTHATPDLARTDATWTCTAGTGKALVTIPIAHQRTGCEHHLYIPPLLRNMGEPVDGGEDYVVYRTADGFEFVNGPGKFSSREIYDCKHKPLLTDPVVQGVKELVPLAQLINTRTVFDDMPSDDPDALPAKPASTKVKKERAAIKRSVDQLQENEVPW
jgi:hypothetical protein